MQRRPYVCVLAPLVAAAIVLTGCSSSKASDAPATAGTPTGAQLTVIAKSFSYDPKTITVKSGDKLTLDLTAKDLPHDFTVSELDIHVHADAGRTVKEPVSFDKPGTYTFFCSIAGHREAGMKGTLVVQ